MKWRNVSVLRNKCKVTYRSLLLIFLFVCPTLLVAQFNFVPNPSFEEIDDCDLEFGETYKANPWKIINTPIASPDLYHTCSTNPFFKLPLDNGSTTVYPISGEGLVGLVNNIPFAEERIYARLLGDLPLNIDIYVAYKVLPRKKFGGPMEVVCYSNTQCLAFSDIQLESKTIVLELDTILDYTDDWTRVETCYQANGNEKMVLLGNFKLTSETLMDCDHIAPDANFAYFFVDDVVVAPFDVVPDTLFICGDETLNIDATFFDIPILWDDGLVGGNRNISEGGHYTIMGDVGDCFLMDEMEVIKIPDEMESINLDICNDGELILETPVIAEWSNGEIGRTLIINSPGSYSANLLTSCGERIRMFIVEETDCDIQYFVPNVFSPNDDGINDRLEFFFYSEFEFTGELNIFDRWGNHLFKAKNVNAANPVTWNGRYQNEKMNSAVFVWTFQYVIEREQKTRVISGDVTLIR